MGAAPRLQRGAEGMPEMQKPVLEHAAPKANQNQGLDSRLAGESKEATLSMQAEGEFFDYQRQETISETLQRFAKRTQDLYRIGVLPELERILGRAPEPESTLPVLAFLQLLSTFDRTL
jgi:hypothetical protein